MPELAVLDHATVLAAVSPAAAIEATREAFLHHHRGDWVMPAKVYLQSPPYGDFRAMPARGGELALLKWITSFPGNPAHGLPTVSGIVCLSDAATGVPLAHHFPVGDTPLSIAPPHHGASGSATKRWPRRATIA